MTNINDFDPRLLLIDEITVDQQCLKLVTVGK